ncbi:MAG: 1-acyl-sn-glycerol-3-phosphate acyltransferase [Bradymonadia bacterium]
MKYLAKIRPGELLLLSVLVLAVVLTLFGGPGADPRLMASLQLHGGLALGFGAVLFVSAKGLLGGLSNVRLFASVGLIAGLYTSLGKLGFALWPSTADATLAAADVAVFGASPALVVAEQITPWGTEFFSAVYLLHIAALYFTLLLEVLRGERLTRESFLFGLTLTYVIGYVVYLLAPAHGPIWFYAEQLSPLPSGPVFEAMTHAVEGAGGAIGAFPSLHVGAAVYLCLFNLKHRRMRGLTYIPWVVLIAVSTVYLRHHYWIDWIGGLAAAAVAAWATPRVMRVWGFEAPAPRIERALTSAPSFYRGFRAASRAALSGFFHQRRITGAHNVPAQGPVLLVANHTNGLVDPLVIMSALDRHLTMTGKQTLTEKPLLRWMFNRLGVVWLRRRRDADPRALRRAHNDAALAGLGTALDDGGAVLIFPEGRSHSRPTLDRFKTGAARLALTQLARGQRLTVIPVGLRFDGKGHVGGAVEVVFGDALPLDPKESAQALTDRMSHAVDALLEPRPEVATGRRQRVASALEAMETFVLGGPLAAFGLLANLVPFTLLAALVRKGAQDPDHPATFAVYGAMFICPAIYLLQGAALLTLLGPWWALGLSALFTPAGIYALRWLTSLFGPFSLISKSSLTESAHVRLPSR